MTYHGIYRHAEQDEIVLRCPDCGDLVSPEELVGKDVGGYEEAYGSRVWKPCVIYLTPCCLAEVE